MLSYCELLTLMAVSAKLFNVFYCLLTAHFVCNVKNVLFDLSKITYFHTKGGTGNKIEMYWGSKEVQIRVLFLFF